VARYLGDPDFSNLPRKYKSAISGCADHCTLHEINDVAFVGVEHPELGLGYDLWVGGGLSTAPMLGQRLGGFVQPYLVADTWAGVTALFRDYGYRRSRNRARLKFLVRDWGPRRIREVLEAEYLKEPLPDGPAPAPPRTDSRDHVGVAPQRDGRFSVGTALRAGRTSGTSLRALAELADEYGDGRIRTTTHQKVIVLDVPGDRVERLSGELDRHGFAVRPSAFRRSTMACTGIEYCKLAIVETKSRATDLAAELERRLPGFAESVGIHLNGCPNSCARFQVADIGLKGSIVAGGEGFQLHLGGHLGRQSRLARKLRGLKVTAEALPDYVEGLLRAFEIQRADGETFADWVLRAEESVLQSGAMTGGRDD
jgi:sulfite reductase (ferredoxin)